jgi:minor extracellular serine protease Vpr
MNRLTRGARLFALAALVLGIAAVPPAFADVSVGSAEPLGSGLWFVQMPSAPTVDGTSVSTVQSEQAAFRSQAQKAGLNFQVRYSFTTLWNGLSVKTNDASGLSVLPGVKAVYPVGSETIGPEETVSPDLITALAMTGADIAHNELGLTGAGVKVGVIDTGIDYDHPDLGGDGVQRSNSTVFPTGRVITGHDYVGDAYDGSNAPVPDNYPDDCAGHGTHVAGIVGANGAVTGVAPDVKFGAYRVFGCVGSAQDDVILAALQQAYADGMQVVNMSLGDAFNNWPQAPLAQASDTLVNHGVVVVASIGNSGASGLYSAGAPGVGKKVIGVASFDNTHTNLSAFTATNATDTAQVGYITAAASPPAPLSGSLPMAKTGTPTTTNDACSPLAPGSLTGTAVLIRRGTCTFYTKAKNAQDAGAAAVVLYNNAAGFVSPTVAGTPPITIPVVATSNTFGATLDAMIASSATTLTWTTDTVSIPNATGGLISSFSSYGLAADLSLKPDIGAPGGFIRSTYPIELGSYANLSGTSMSSPHVAGAVALLLQATPNTPTNAVRSILQNSAVPAPFDGTPFLDSVHRQGAGMLHIDRAILATTKIEPGKLSLGEGAGGPITNTLTLTNAGSSAVTYDLSNQGAVATGPNIFVPQFFVAPAAVGFSAPSVVVPAGGSASVDVTITAPTTLDAYIYGGYITFTPQGGGQVYRVPYAGLTGDYQSIQILVPTPLGFPWLAKLNGASFTNQPAGATFTLAGGDIPYFLAHFDLQAARLKADVNRVSDGKSFGTAFNYQYLSRNSTPTSFFAFPWDGTAAKGPNVSDVPNGTYKVTLTVTKPLGTASEVETWTSPPITIARP